MRVRIVAILSAPLPFLTGISGAAAFDIQSLMQEAVRNTVQSAAQSAVHSAVQSAVQSAVHSAVQSAAQSAVHSAVQSAAHSAVHSAVQSAAHSAVHSAVQSATQNGVHSAVHSSTQSAVNGATRYAIQRRPIAHVARLPTVASKVNIANAPKTSTTARDSQSAASKLNSTTTSSTNVTSLKTRDVKAEQSGGWTTNPDGSQTYNGPANPYCKTPPCVFPALSSAPGGSVSTQSAGASAPAGSASPSVLPNGNPIPPSNPQPTPSAGVLVAPPGPANVLPLNSGWCLGQLCPDNPNGRKLLIDTGINPPDPIPDQPDGGFKTDFATLADYMKYLKSLPTENQKNAFMNETSDIYNQLLNQQNGQSGQNGPVHPATDDLFGSVRQRYIQKTQQGEFIPPPNE
jgi:hypothetical protein